MPSSTASFLVILFVTLVLVLRCEAYSSRRCPARIQSAEEISRLRDGCKYGVYEDNCSRYHCAKGPGDYCGNPNSMFQSYGQCGDGLKCGCGRCMGCSSLVFPIQCHDQVCNEE